MNNPKNADEGNRNPSGNKENQKDSAYKNIETKVNNPGYFNDDFESKEEDKISNDNAQEENYNG